jgi:hypothetical protein
VLISSEVPNSHRGGTAKNPRALIRSKCVFTRVSVIIA